jgi:hypothetical protein
VRVGRAPLDEEAIKLIEEYHPDIQFDWQQILKGAEEAAPVPVREVRREPARDVGAVPPPSGPAADAPISPAHAQLGSEGLSRLRARYAEVLAGISRRVTDPERQEVLRTAADRLNPDNWVTADEVRLGLEQYEAVLESIRSQLGRRRRRRTPRSPDGGGDGTEGAPAAGGHPDRAADADEASADAGDGPDPESGPASQD